MSIQANIVRSLADEDRFEAIRTGSGRDRPGPYAHIARSVSEGGGVDRKTIVVIDEQQLFRAGVRQVLSQYPSLDVLECGPSDDILKLIETRIPEVVLLGCRLTVHSSLALAERIARDFPKTRVIMLSPDPDDGELFEVIKTSAVACVNKNASVNELINTVKSVCSDECPINYAVTARRAIAHRVPGQIEEIAALCELPAGGEATPLTSRESQILTYVADGNTNKQIAATLRISEQTIKNHLSAVMRKLSANDRAHAVVVAARHGWISLEFSEANQEPALAHPE